MSGTKVDIAPSIGTGGAFSEVSGNPRTRNPQTLVVSGVTSRLLTSIVANPAMGLMPKPTQINEGLSSVANERAWSRLMGGDNPYHVTHDAKKTMPDGTINVLNHGNPVLHMIEPIYEEAIRAGLLQPNEKIRDNAHAKAVIDALFNHYKSDPNKTMALVARLLNPYGVTFRSDLLQSWQRRLDQGDVQARNAVNAKRAELGLAVLSGVKPDYYQVVWDIFSGKFRDPKNMQPPPAHQPSTAPSGEGGWYMPAGAPFFGFVVDNRKLSKNLMGTPKGSSPNVAPYGTKFFDDVRKYFTDDKLLWVVFPKTKKTSPGGEEIQAGGGYQFVTPVGERYQPGTPLNPAKFKWVLTTAVPGTSSSGHQVGLGNAMPLDPHGDNIIYYNFRAPVAEAMRQYLEKPQPGKLVCMHQANLGVLHGIGCSVDGENRKTYVGSGLAATLYAKDGKFFVAFPGFSPNLQSPQPADLIPWAACEYALALFGNLLNVASSGPNGVCRDMRGVFRDAKDGLQHHIDGLVGKGIITQQAGKKMFSAMSAMADDILAQSLVVQQQSSTSGFVPAPAISQESTLTTAISNLTNVAQDRSQRLNMLRIWAREAVLGDTGLGAIQLKKLIGTNQGLVELIKHGLGGVVTDALASDGYSVLFRHARTTALLQGIAADTKLNPTVRAEATELLRRVQNVLSQAAVAQVPTASVKPQASSPHVLPTEKQPNWLEWGISNLKKGARVDQVRLLRNWGDELLAWTKNKNEPMTKGAQMMRALLSSAGLKELNTLGLPGVVVEALSQDGRSVLFRNFDTAALLGRIPNATSFRQKVENVLIARDVSLGITQKLGALPRADREAILNLLCNDEKARKLFAAYIDSPHGEAKARWESYAASVLTKSGLSQQTVGQTLAWLGNASAVGAVGLKGLEFVGGLIQGLLTLTAGAMQRS